MSAAASAAEAGQQSTASQPLDEVMLAMDVVDTLRRRRRLVDKELAGEESADELKERLRKIYAAQGIEVPDAVLEQGVKALREDRFVYKPPRESMATRLARWYVQRDRWGKWAMGAVAAVSLAVGGYWNSVIAPRAALPDELAAIHQQLGELARGAAGRERSDVLYSAGQAALRDGDDDAAAAALQSLQQLRADLEQSYSLQIVARPGENSGVWRIPDANSRARNYYLIVEPVDADGKRVSVLIENEETGRSERVKKWGLRVDEAEFQAVAADKKDDGIIQNRQIGRKRVGWLQPDYSINTSGAAITQW